MIGVQTSLRHKIIPALCAVVLAFAGNITPAAAACPPGQPCNVPLTPDPNTLDRVIPSNQPSAPNAPKLGHSSHACDADFMNQIYAKDDFEIFIHEVIYRIRARDDFKIIVQEEILQLSI